MPKHWLKNLSHRAAHIKMLQPVYGMSLGRLDSVLEFQNTPADLFGGDAGRGRWIANGQMDLNGHRMPLDFDTWFIGTNYENSPFFEKLHGFDFLLELKSLGGDVGRQSARMMTHKWLEQFQNYHPLLWQSDLTATRLVNWLIAYDFAYASASDDFLEQFHDCIYRQYHHLKNTIEIQNNDVVLDRYAALWGVLIVQCHCSQLYDEIEFQSYLQLLKGVLDDMTYAEGGLINHNLNNVVELSKSLLQLKQSLLNVKKSIPQWLLKKIESNVRMVNIMTHMDKDLPQFQGNILPNKSIIEKVTKVASIRHRRNDKQYLESGYTSIRKGRTSILVEHGVGQHLSPLAFEMGYGMHRIVVNCGTYFNDDVWAQSLAGISAHSCLSIDGVDPKKSLLNFKTTLENLNSSSLFSGSHDGYLKDYGVSHTRRLYLDSDGDDFRGEDVLARNISIKSIDCVTRFHLHPSVKSSVVDDGMGVLIKLPNGVGWDFHVNQGTVTLEESIHCSDGFHLRKSWQIVVRTCLDDLSTHIKWAFKRH